MLTSKYSELNSKLLALIPKTRLFDDELRRLAYGTDASFYRLIPKLVIKANNEEEVVFIINICNELKIPVTFRAAGTSLSGQAVTDSVLVVLSSKWNKFEIADDLSTIKLQPGVTGGIANFYLSQHNKKIGPDPASINSAMIGGIAANNASGMCCGTSQNSYKTLAGMRIVFNDGSVLDTNNPVNRHAFISTHKDFISQIDSLSKEVKNNSSLSELICRKYKMKNTMGYSLNALIDFDDPIEIIQHLMIGSEGTLGFISEITYYTVPDYKDKATSLILFPDTVTAGKAVAILKQCKVAAVELMDRASIRSVENKPGMPEYLKDLDNNASALLVETRAENEQVLDNNIAEIKATLKDIAVLRPVNFTKDKKEYEKLWNIRKGLFPSVGAMRKTGTTVIIEDVAFPVNRLAEAINDLQNLFIKHSYNDAIIFGHALEGNLHFVFKQDFNSAPEINRYKDFMDDVTKLVITKYDGALKAEHGTGRNMAPFLEFEWGKEALQVMKKIKNIFDPDNLFNPGVILNNDHNVHIKNLKPLPSADKLIDKCIECGFCEINCPSKDLTLTPRQRIVVFREISALRAAKKDPHRLSTLLGDFDYYGNQTCATDGLCAISCPVDINTGNLIKELRVENNSPSANAIAWVLAGNMKAVTGGLKISLNILSSIHSILGTKLMEKISVSLRKVSGNKIPLWNRYMPKGADKLLPDSSANHDTKSDSSTAVSKVIYFPSCINRTMGISKFSDDNSSLTTITQRLLHKAGYEIIYPENIDNLCCGMAFASKGFKKQGDSKSEELIEALIKTSDNGKYPVLFDMSPCLSRIKEYLNYRDHNKVELKIYEPAEFILEYMASKLHIKKIKDTITVHSTCSTTKMGLSDKLITLAEMCAENVIIPKETGCCGWAGDRGFTYPELNASALESLKQAVEDKCTHGYSTSRTCEIGLSMHTNLNYESIIYLVDKCSEPLSKKPELQTF